MLYHYYYYYFFSVSVFCLACVYNLVLFQIISTICVYKIYLYYHRCVYAENLKDHKCEHTLNCTRKNNFFSRDLHIFHILLLYWTMGVRKKNEKYNNIAHTHYLVIYTKINTNSHLIWLVFMCWTYKRSNTNYFFIFLFFFSWILF